MVCWKTGGLKSFLGAHQLRISAQVCQMKIAEWDQPHGCSVMSQESTPGAEDSQPKEGSESSNSSKAVSKSSKEKQQYLISGCKRKQKKRYSK